MCQDVHTGIRKSKDRLQEDGQILGMCSGIMILKKICIAIMALSHHPMRVMVRRGN
jgi:hypothetical protein